MAHKLNVVNGLIQGNTVAGIPLHRKIVLGRGARNVRTFLRITPNAICIHNTGNPSPTADDLNHARYLQNLENADKTYLSVHFFVDDDSMTQVLPITEMAYHAGNAYGNRTSIAIEICENRNPAKAEANAKELAASLLLTYPHLDIKKHQDYSGKYCPRVILSRGGWSKFVADIRYLTQPVIQPTQHNFLVTIKVPNLNYRSGPGVSYPIRGQVHSPTKYTIVAVKNGWGKLKSGAGWINISDKFVTKG